MPRARRPLACAPTGLCLVLAVALACKPSAEQDVGDEAPSDPSAASASDSDDETTGEPPIGDACDTTPWQLIAPSRTRASLRDATPSPIPAACGIDGPVVFFDIELPARIDLSAEVVGRAASPKLALMRPGCVDSGVDPARVLACAEALPATLFDIGPASALTIAVGVSQDDPALALDPTLEDHDPLEFELALTARWVLAHGEPCGQPNTRCEAGTVCMREAELEPDSGPDTGTDTGTGDDTLRCIRPEADSCIAPGELALALDVPTQILIEPDEPHSDAHEHPCTGWRRPERVEQLTLPTELPPDAELVVRANDGRVGLALRGPSCLVEDALACAAAGAPDETFLVWGGEALAAAAAAEQALLLFIELPRSDAELPVETLTVELEIVSG